MTDRNPARGFGSGIGWIRTGATCWHDQVGCGPVTTGGDVSFRRVSPVAAHSGDRLLSEPTAGTQPCRREPLFMLRVFGCLPVTDSATRSEGRRPKSLRGGNRGGSLRRRYVGLWGFSVDVGPD